VRPLWALATFVSRICNNRPEYWHACVKYRNAVAHRSPGLAALSLPKGGLPWVSSTHVACYAEGVTQQCVCRRCLTPSAYTGARRSASGNTVGRRRRNGVQLLSRSRSSIARRLVAAAASQRCSSPDGLNSLRIETTFAKTPRRGFGHLAENPDDFAQNREKQGFGHLPHSPLRLPHFLPATPPLSLAVPLRGDSYRAKSGLSRTDPGSSLSSKRRRSRGRIFCRRPSCRRLPPTRGAPSSSRR
jgi:hypothetical protein